MEASGLKRIPISLSFPLKRAAWIGAVGIEFAVNSLSPVDSVSFAAFLPLEMHLESSVLSPRCAQILREGR
jgi:hypothetical protein